MNATKFRTWLGECTGKKLEVSPGFLHVQGAASRVLNGTCAIHIPIKVTAVHKKTFGIALGTPNKVAISNSDVAGKDGVWLPDQENECTRVNADTSGGIVISGRFTGCTFALCTSNTGELWAGHVYVNSNMEGNNPTAQARAFETACGATANSATGFSTHRQLGENGDFGLVVGTDVGGWQWNWVVVARGGNPRDILSVRDISNDFVNL